MLFLSPQYNYIDCGRSYTVLRYVDIKSDKALKGQTRPGWMMLLVKKMKKCHPGFDILVQVKNVVGLLHLSCHDILYSHYGRDLAPMQSLYSSRRRCMLLMTELEAEAALY